MQRILVHVAMVLLGVTLTVGFYEGRRLVANTARAFSALSASSTPAGPGARRGREQADEGDDPEAASVADAPGRLQRPLDPALLGPRSAEDLGARTRFRGDDPSDPGGRRGKRGGRRARRMAAGGAVPIGPDFGEAARSGLAEVEARPPAPGAEPEARDTGRP